MQGAGGTSTGILLGGNASYSYVFGALRDNTVKGFGTGLEISTNSYIDTFINNRFDSNTTNLYLPSSASNMGENLNFIGGIFSQPAGVGTSFSATCVNLDAGTGSDIHFYGVSFDQCGVSLNNLNITANFTDSHFEDSSNGSAIPFIQCGTTAQNCQINSYGSIFLEDVASTRTAFITGNTTTANTGVTINMFGGMVQPAETLTSIIQDATACCMQSEVMGVRNQSGFNWTNVFSGVFANGSFSDLGNLTQTQNLTATGQLYGVKGAFGPAKTTADPFDVTPETNNGPPYCGINQVTDNPYLECQRWSGTGSDFVGSRIINDGSHLLWQISSSAVVGSQVWTTYATLYNTSGDFAITGKSTATHFVALGTPTIACGTGAGTGGTCTFATGSNDENGVITVVTGTTPANAGVIFTVTQANPCSHAPAPTVRSANANASSLTGNTHDYPTGTGASTWTLTANATGLSATTTYIWNYHAGCY